METLDIVTVRFACSSRDDDSDEAPYLRAPRIYLITRYEYFRCMFSKDRGFAEAKLDDVTIDMDLSHLKALGKDAWPTISRYLVDDNASCEMPASRLYYLHKILHHVNSESDLAKIRACLESRIINFYFGVDEQSSTPHEVAFLFMLCKESGVDFGGYFTRHAVGNIPEYVSFKEQVCEVLELEDTVDFIIAWNLGVVEPEALTDHVCVDLLSEFGQGACKYRPPMNPAVVTPCTLQIHERAVCTAAEFDERVREFMGPCYDGFPWYTDASKSSGVILTGSCVATLLCGVSRPRNDPIFFVWGKDQKGRDDALGACIRHTMSAWETPYLVRDGDTVIVLPVGANTAVNIVPTGYSSPWEVVRGFDMDWERCYYADGKVYATTECFTALRSRCMTVFPRDLPLWRCHKALECKFSISKHPACLSRWNLPTLSDGEALKFLLWNQHSVSCEVQGYYYPRADEDPQRHLFLIYKIYGDMNPTKDATRPLNMSKFTGSLWDMESFKIAPNRFVKKERIYYIEDGPPQFCLGRVFAFRGIVPDKNIGSYGYRLTVIFHETAHLRMLELFRKLATQIPVRMGDKYLVVHPLARPFKDKGYYAIDFYLGSAAIEEGSKRTEVIFQQDNVSQRAMISMPPSVVSVYFTIDDCKATAGRFVMLPEVQQITVHSKSK